MFEPFDSDTLEGREMNVIGLCQQLAPKLTSAHARRHVTEGLMRRVSLMQTSRSAMERIADPNRQDILKLEESSDLNVHLNSFYVHMRGAFDNLAWTLHYELGVLGQRDENDRDTQRKCNLFDGRFLTALDEHRADLAASLRSRLDWSDEFRNLRDPIAHRVPLYATPGIVHEGSDDHLRIQVLEAEASKLIAQGDALGAMERMRASYFTGKYHPLFGLSGVDGYELRPLIPQVVRDYDVFLDVSRATLRSLPGAGITVCAPASTPDTSAGPPTPARSQSRPAAT